jgi:hypothetical protein
LIFGGTTLAFRESGRHPFNQSPRMIKNRTAQSRIFNTRCLLSVSLCLSGIFLAALSFAAPANVIANASEKDRYLITGKRLQRPGASPTSRTISLNGSSAPGWSIVTSPNDGTDKWNFLRDITCASADECWAVGAHRNSSGFDQTLIEHWNGAAWSIVPSLNRSAQNSYLWAVTCPSQNECWAVGDYSNGIAMQTQIEHWDGGSWTIVFSPNMNTQNNYLSGISCVGADECWAVGSYDNGTDHQTLIERWDGNSWSIIPSPNNSQKSRLASVICISERDCWAVGGDLLGSALTEHWNGSSWSIVASPITSSYAILANITCMSSSQCWAVGYYYAGYGDPLSLTSSQTLIEQWDGASWSIVPSPSPGTRYNQLGGIACSSTSDCWTVGQYGNSNGGGGGTLVEHWSGNSWSVVTSPSKGYSNLGGVACTSASQCWGVGQYLNDVVNPAVSQTLVEEYASTIPPLINVASRMNHGPAGAFDVDLSLTGKRGVECRSGGQNGNYSVVFTFVNDVTNCGSAGTAGGTIVPGPSSNQCTENLTGVANAQYIYVELDNVVDSQSNTGNVAVPMGVLIGDTTANGVVNSSDISQTQSQSGQSLTSNNFREDVTANGLINSSDIALVQSKSGTGLPSPP